MIHSQEVGDLFTALAAFQSEVDAIPKGSTNPFFQSKYADLPDVVAAASPLLTKNGLAVSQLLGHDEHGDTLTTIVGHKSGQYIGDTMRLRPVKNDPQAQGSATTYGRRYAYMAALGLVADHDDDGQHASTAPRKRDVKSTRKSDVPAPPPPTDAEWAALKAAFAAAGSPDITAKLDELGVAKGDTQPERIATLTQDQARALTVYLKERPA